MGAQGIARTRRRGANGAPSFAATGEIRGSEAVLRRNAEQVDVGVVLADQVRAAAVLRVVDRRIVDQDAGVAGADFQRFARHPGQADRDTSCGCRRAGAGCGRRRLARRLVAGRRRRAG